MDFWVLKKCSCGIEPSEETVKESIEGLRGNSFALRIPKRESLAANSPELVLQNGNVWLFFFGGDGATRLLGADGFRYLAGHETRTLPGTSVVDVAVSDAPSALRNSRR